MRRRLIFIFLFFISTGGVYSQPLSAILPKNGSYSNQSLIQLSWNTHPDATDYQIEFTQDPTFSSGVSLSPVLLTGIWSNSFSSGDWFWRVVTNTPSGTLTSNINHFVWYQPDESNNLSLWLDPSNGVGLDLGNGVSGWADQSATGVNMAQSDSLKRPIFIPSSLNGLPALQFNGSKYLSGGDVLDLGTANRSMIIIGKSNGTNQCFFAKARQGAFPDRLALLLEGSDSKVVYHDASPRIVLHPNVVNDYALYSVVVDRNNAKVRLGLNNSYGGDATILGGYNLNSAFRFLLGAYNGGNDDSEILFLNGEINEVVFLDTSDSTELLQVQYYLRDKYNPPLDLGEDIYVQDRFCDTNLTVSSGYSNILWSTGATTPTIAVNEGAYWVEGTDLFGFVHRDTIEVHYPEIPGPPTTGVCAGSDVVWNADLGAGFTYVWSTAETTPSISITSAGNYSVEVFDGYGCSRLSSTETFTIDNYATTATLGNDTSLCVGNELYLQVGAPETVSYLWPDASTGPLYGVDTTGMYWVEATNGNGCVAQDTVNIMILGNAPTAFFNAPDGCLGQVTLFTDASTPQGGDPITNWDWDFGDSNADNIQNTSNQYASNGMYIVTLDIVAQSGCGDRYIDTVNIFTPPGASYTFSGHCAADSVYFTDASTLGEASLTAWSWNFGQPLSGQNTSSLSNPSHVYDAVYSFDVELIVTDMNGCQDTLVQTLNIDPSPESLFTLVDGCLDLPLNVTNNATIGAPGFIVSYNWDFGDGTTSTSSNPNKSYTTHGTYDVQFVTTSNLACTDTVIQQVTIHALPAPNFVFNNECVGLPTIFTDVSTVADGNIDSTRWIYDVIDTLYGNQSSFVFTTEGDHFVKLSTYSEFGCQKDTIKVVPVGPALNAAFTTLNGGSIIVGSPVQFNNTTNGGDSYLWDLGDLTTSTEESPTHSYAEVLLDSTITVQLIANNNFGCSDTVEQSFTISRAMLDLELQKLFLLENNGYFDVAVQLHNKGTARIEGAYLELTLQNGTVMLEDYPDTLYAGQTQIHVLNSHPSAVIWLVILIVIANNYRSKHEDQEHYKYFMPNLYAKLFFALVFSFFYVVIFKGGDTVAYFETSRVMNKLLLHSPGEWFMQMNTDPNMGVYGKIFGHGVGYPPGWIYREPEAFFVAKIFSLISWLTFNSYWATTLIIAYIAARASWRLYELALDYNLNNPRWLAYGLLFLPSVNFWCAGISKDTVVFISVLYLVFHLFSILSDKHKTKLKNYFWAAFFAYIILQTRSFILAAVLLPFALAYLSRWLRKRNTSEGGIMAIYLFSIVLGIVVFGATLTGQGEAETLEGNSFLQEAQVVQQDFEQNQTYGEKRYSLGDIEFSPLGMIRIAPLALAAGLFRPYVWEALSPSFIFNGLESVLLIILTVIFLVNKPWQKLKKINANELLIFSLLFALLLAFMAGFSSILFGVLVRIRAPLLPFLMIILTINWKCLLPNKENELESQK